MKVTGIEAIPCRGSWMNWTFVKVTTDEGIVGWGDATEWVRVKAHIAAMEDLKPLVIGENPFNIERIWQRMWTASYAGGKDVNVAMCGIETALWDIVGKALNTPVYNLLGGKCFETVRLYYDYCDGYGEGMQGTNEWHWGDKSLEGLAMQAQKIKDLGFTALKMHPVGMAPRPAITRTMSMKAIDDTVKRVEIVREIVGNEVDIAMDVHNRLDLPSAMALADALEPYRLMFFEDPIRQEESAVSYQRLADSTKTPIGTGENLYTTWSFRNLLEIGGIDVALPDFCHTGVLQGKKIASLCETFHVPLAPHNPNSPLSTIISGHICASIPNNLALEYWSDERDAPWRDDVISTPLTEFVKNGELSLPDKPGWGVELDEKEIAKHPYSESWYAEMSIGYRHN